MDIYINIWVPTKYADFSVSGRKLSEGKGLTYVHINNLHETINN